MNIVYDFRIFSLFYQKKRKQIKHKVKKKRALNAKILCKSQTGKSFIKHCFSGTIALNYSFISAQLDDT